MANINSRDDWHFGNDYVGNVIDFSNKQASVFHYVSQMLNRTQSMFEYSGLPDTITKRNLELAIQTRGFVVVPDPKKVPDGKLYAFGRGAALGGVPDVYYMPTKAMISSPALNWSSKPLNIGSECVVIPNDSLYIGLRPMMERYSTMLAENDVTLRMADIQSRIVDLICAPDDRTRKAAEKYLEDVVAGKLGVIADNAFLDGIKAQPYGSHGSNNSITQAIELHQYIKGCFFNDVGINAAYNMKREYVGSAESALNEDALLPLCENMLECRQIGFNKVNELYGTNIKVRFSSTWLRELESVENPETDMEVNVDDQTD